MVTVGVRPPTVGPGRIDVSVGQFVLAVIVVMAILYIGFLIASGQTTTTLDRFVRLFSEVEGQKTDEGASRFIYWPAAVRMWIDAPWIGHGYASFSFIFQHGAEVDGAHPHNVLLEILAELGLVGLALFGLFVWSGLRHATRGRLRDDPLMVCVVVYMATAMMNSMFAKELTGGRKLFFALALFALEPASRAVTAQIGGRWANRGGGGVPGRGAPRRPCLPAVALPSFPPRPMTQRPLLDILAPVAFVVGLLFLVFGAGSRRDRPGLPLPPARSARRRFAARTTPTSDRRLSPARLDLDAVHAAGDRRRADRAGRDLCGRLPSGRFRRMDRRCRR